MPARFRIYSFDTGSIAGTTDTLNGAISSSVTAITLTSGTGTVNGTQLKIGSEQMLILSGGGTASLTVQRGFAGTTAASHANGATVNVAGALTYDLLQIATIPNQSFTFAKTSADINYVMLVTFTGDTLPGGGGSIILADNSANLGTTQMTAPGIGTQWIQTSGAGAAGASAAAAGSVGDSTINSVTGFIDPISGTITLTVAVTPPGTLGSWIGDHLYFEGPDQSTATPMVVGSTPIGTAAVTGNWQTVDVGEQVYVASQQPWTVSFPAPPDLDATVNTTCRLYAVSFSTAIENKLVQANQSGPSPSLVFNLVSLASGSPTSGTNVTTLTGGDGSLIGIVATALPPVNVTGKLQTPFIVDLTDTPPSTPGWAAQLVLVLQGLDPTIQANQQVVSTAPITQAGPVYQAGDGINVPHSFVLDTPTVITKAVIYLQAGLVDAQGNAQWNNIVPGITPSFPVSYGATTGTTDAAAIMTASITASMAVVNGLFGVAAAGITNPLLGSGAVATINVQALAITNPLLAALAVQAANLATGSVTATAIGAAAVGTAAIANAAITNALIANLAVSAAQIQSATITGAQIASATIAGANIGSATITQANIANLAVGNAQIQNLAVTDAKINDLSASKITAGTISATISITAPTITGGTFTGSTLVLNANGVTTSINNSTVASLVAGLSVKDNSTSKQACVSASSVYGVDASGNVPFAANMITVGPATFGELTLSNTGTAQITLNAGGPSISIAGNQVLSTRVGTTPVTLADVIAVLQHHGLSN